VRLRAVREFLAILKQRPLSACRPMRQAQERRQVVDRRMVVSMAMPGWGSRRLDAAAHPDAATRRCREIVCRRTGADTESGGEQN